MFWAFGEYAAYLAASAALMAAAVAAYARITPYHEAQLIRDGNIAAACSLTGAVLGISLAVAGAVRNSFDFIDMALWAALSAMVQMLVYWAASLILPGLKTQISNGNIAAGILLGGISVGVGLLNAAALAD